MKQLKIGDLLPKVPVIQGGMGVGISLSKLASAVAREGGIGVISAAQIGFKENDFETNTQEANERALASEIRKAKAESMGGIVGVNIMVASKNYADLVKVAVKEKIDLIISGAGLPTSLPELVKGSNVKIVPIVSSARALDVILKIWNKRYQKDPDAIVIEGPEAGGHLGFSKDELDNNESHKIMDIYKEVIEKMNGLKKKFPVIVAGGFFTGEDVAKAMEEGADGVQMATRFVTTEECDADIKFKEAYINAKEEDIKIMKSPVGMPGRAIRNPFLNKVEEAGRIKPEKCYQCISKCNPAETPFCITKALVNAANGNVDEGLIFVGSNAKLSSKIETVKEIFDEIKKELNLRVSEVN